MKAAAEDQGVWRALRRRIRERRSRRKTMYVPSDQIQNLESRGAKAGEIQSKAGQCLLHFRGSGILQAYGGPGMERVTRIMIVYLKVTSVCLTLIGLL
jgi:hypothetical protein